MIAGQPIDKMPMASHPGETMRAPFALVQATAERLAEIAKAKPVKAPTKKAAPPPVDDDTDDDDDRDDDKDDDAPPPKREDTKKRELAPSKSAMRFDIGGCDFAPNPHQRVHGESPATVLARARAPRFSSRARDGSWLRWPFWRRSSS